MKTDIARFENYTAVECRHEGPWAMFHMPVPKLNVTAPFFFPNWIEVK